MRLDLGHSIEVNSPYKDNLLVKTRMPFCASARAIRYRRHAVIAPWSSRTLNALMASLRWGGTPGKPGLTNRAKGAEIANRYVLIRRAGCTETCLSGSTGARRPNPDLGAAGFVFQ